MAENQTTNMDQTQSDRSEIVFFDVETTVPNTGQGHAILEFGAILVSPRTLKELHSYTTLIRPSDLCLLSQRSVSCISYKGITREDVISAPTFAQVADEVFDLLQGRIWAGHNILRFDCPRVREAFAGIGRMPPEPKGTIDSLQLLTQRFGRRAGNMKMATLARYFDLGTQTHRSLGDARMNLDVLKNCATVLFLESSLPEVLEENNYASPTLTTRSRATEKVSPVSTGDISISDAGVGAHRMSSPDNDNLGEQILGLVEPSSSSDESFSMRRLSEEIPQDAQMTETTATGSVEISASLATDNCSSSTSFLTPDKVSIQTITASFVPFYRGRRIEILHNSNLLKLQCASMRIRFGISTKFLDHAGRPRLSIVVDSPPQLSQVLDACDNHAQELLKQSGSTSEWKAVTTRKTGFWHYPTIRLNIPALVIGDVAKYRTDIYQKDAHSGAEEKIIFSKFDAAELDCLLTATSVVDGYFSLDTYDYQQRAGIRLVAEKLVIHSK